MTNENAQHLLGFQPLYKTTSTGAEQIWRIRVLMDGAAAIINTEWGQVDGAKQETNVVISKGKNIGKKNETSAFQQAMSEAESKWKKQLDKGYAVERGGQSMAAKPMLAHKYEDHKKKVTFESAYVQPKLDGVRCLASRNGETISLTSRQNKPFGGLDHIRKWLLSVMDDGEIWDGELYIHEIPFESVISLIKDPTQEGSSEVTYCVYDTIKNESFAQRFWQVDIYKGNYGPIKFVETFPITNHEQVTQHHEKFVSEGFEGAIVRWGDAPYKAGYRSHNLLKVKSWMDDEYLIIGVDPGIGKCENQGIFVCETEDKKEFRVKIKGPDELRELILANPEKYIGQSLTVKYFGLTSDGIPRFPVGLKIKDGIE